MGYILYKVDERHLRDFYVWIVPNESICGKIWAITILIRVRGKVRGWVQFCTCLMGSTLH